MLAPTETLTRDEVSTIFVALAIAIKYNREEAKRMRDLSYVSVAGHLEQIAIKMEATTKRLTELTPKTLWNLTSKSSGSFIEYGE